MLHLLLLLLQVIPQPRSMLTIAVDPSPSTSGDSSIRSMLDTVMTIQVTRGQLLVNVLIELQALYADLASIRQTPPPPPFDDES